MSQTTLVRWLNGIAAGASNYERDPAKTELANAACQDHKAHAGGHHLLWIYWQETGGNVQENTTARHGMHNRLGQFLSDIRMPSNKLPLPNVIGHDFVNKNTCREIAKMNPDLRNTNID